MTKVCWKWKFLYCSFPNAFPPVWQWAAWASFAICVGGSNLGGRRRSADCSPPSWARSCSSSSKLLTPTYQGWGVDCDEVVAGLFIGDKAAASSVPFLRRQVLGWDAIIHSADCAFHFHKIATTNFDEMPCCAKGKCKWILPQAITHVLNTAEGQDEGRFCSSISGSKKSEYSKQYIYYYIIVWQDIGDNYLFSAIILSTHLEPDFFV